MSAKDFDPVSGGGDGTENPQDLPLILDGDPATAWQAERYFSAALGGRKPGVGVWLQLGATAEVHRVVIQSGLSGWTFELRSGSSPADATALRSIGGETSFTAGASGRTVIDLRPATVGGILIWITGLAPDAGRFTAEISGVSVVGRAG